MSKYSRALRRLGRAALAVALAGATLAGILLAALPSTDRPAMDRLILRGAGAMPGPIRSAVRKTPTTARTSNRTFSAERGMS